MYHVWVSDRSNPKAELAILAANMWISNTLILDRIPGNMKYNLVTCTFSDAPSATGSDHGATASLSARSNTDRLKLELATLLRFLLNATIIHFIILDLLGGFQNYLCYKYLMAIS